MLQITVQDLFFKSDALVEHLGDADGRLCLSKSPYLVFSTLDLGSGLLSLPLSLCVYAEGESP